VGAQKLMEINLSNLSLFLTELAEERKIPKEKVIEILEAALAGAYRKEYGKKEEKYRVRFNPTTKKPEFFLVKKVVDKTLVYENSPEEGKVKFNPYQHIWLDEAEKIKKGVKVGEEIEFPVPYKETFGRIAAQTAKQILIQKLREAEKESIFQKFKEKEGEIVSGLVQRKEGNNVFVDLQDAIGILPKHEQIPKEFYKPNTRMKFLCLEVRQTSKGPEIILSRRHPKFLVKLFELEVPEISSKTVEIKSVARIPGVRSKIAVMSKEEGVDPIGSLIGPRGTRVSAVIQELSGEKIDIVKYSQNPEEFIKNALLPAKVAKIELKNDKAIVEVPENELSLAIGKDGQNVKLASDLTSWKIEIKTTEESS